MSKAISPLAQVEDGVEYPPNPGTNRRGCLRWLLAGGLGALAASCTPHLRGGTALRPDGLYPRAADRTAAPRTTRLRTRIVLYLAVAPGQRVIVESSDLRFMNFLDTPRARAALLLNADPTRPGPRASGAPGQLLGLLGLQRAASGTDSVRPSSPRVRKLLRRFYRARTGRCAPAVDITLMPQFPDHARLPGAAHKIER